MFFLVAKLLYENSLFVGHALRHWNVQRFTDFSLCLPNRPDSLMLQRKFAFFWGKCQQWETGSSKLQTYKRCRLAYIKCNFSADKHVKLGRSKINFCALLLIEVFILVFVCMYMCVCAYFFLALQSYYF